jgi:hypothetical protein
MPNVTPLPQISHFAISCTSLPLENQKPGVPKTPTSIISDDLKKCKHKLCGKEKNLPRSRERTQKLKNIQLFDMAEL